MNELELLEARLLERARRGYSAAANSESQVRAATLSAITAGAAVSMSAPGLTVRDATRALRNALTLPRAFVAALALGSAGGGGYLLGLREGASRAAAPAASSASAPSRETAMAPAPLPLIEVAPQPALPEKKRPSPSAASATPQTTRSAAAASSEHELSTLRRVERVLREGNPRFALALLTELDRNSPQGRLMEERQAARAVAECQLATPAVARTLAATFSERYPSSVYTRRVRETCAVEAEGERIEAPAETHDSKGSQQP